MKYLSLLLTLAAMLTLQSCAQTSSQKNINSAERKTKVGGSCEGCEAIHESPIPFEQLKSVDTLPDFTDAGPKIEISGIVYHRDGKTPAKDIVIYVYHTDQKGVYPKKGNEKGWGKRHGYIRGWVKTDQNGFYQFYTLRPAAYPDHKDPQHIHIIIKEPDKNEYWIDDYLFKDDPLMQVSEHGRKPRGSSGIIELVPQPNGIFHGTRHIILGLNVPDYPYAGLPKVKSGLALGSNCPAFDPLHVSGADIGKKACPMCKYGYDQGIMVWFNHANLDHMAEFIQKVEQEMRQHGEKKLRVFFVYMNPFYKENNSETERGIIAKKLRQWCEKEGLQKVAMTWIPSPVDEETAGLYKINPEAKNTVFVYKKRKIAAKWVNIEYDNETLDEILKTLQL